MGVGIAIARVELSPQLVSIDANRGCVQQFRASRRLIALLRRVHDGHRQPGRERGKEPRRQHRFDQPSGAADP